MNKLVEAWQSKRNHTFVNMGLKQVVVTVLLLQGFLLEIQCKLPFTVPGSIKELTKSSIERWLHRNELSLVYLATEGKWYRKAAIAVVVVTATLLLVVSNKWAHAVSVVAYKVCVYIKITFRECQQMNICCYNFCKADILACKSSMDMGYRYPSEIETFLLASCE